MPPPFPIVLLLVLCLLLLLLLLLLLRVPSIYPCLLYPSPATCLDPHITPHHHLIARPPLLRDRFAASGLATTRASQPSVTSSAAVLRQRLIASS